MGIPLLRQEAGGAMGLRNFLIEEGEPCLLRMPATMALSWCMDCWQAYSHPRVASDPALKAVAEEDLRDSHAVTLVNVIGHFVGSVYGSAYVWDNPLFKFVSLLYLSRRLRDSDESLAASIPRDRLHAFSSLGLELAERIHRVPSDYRLSLCLDTLYRDAEQVLDTFLHSDNAFLMPAGDCKGPARPRLLDAIQDRALRDEIAGIYAAGRERRHWDARVYTDGAAYEFACYRDIYATRSHPYDLEEWSRCSMLTVGQGRELLKAIQRNQLVEALVTQRPPNSAHSSHFMAIHECTEHARLLLAQSNLPVYYNFPDLDYCTLATSTSPLDCRQVLDSPMGFASRVPSPVEKILRRLATDCVDDGDDPRANEFPRTLARAPQGLGFGKLDWVPGHPADNSKDEVWFSKFLDVLQTVATCEPLDKLTYLVGGSDANMYHSRFVDVARETLVIDWPRLQFPRDEDELVYTVFDGDLRELFHGLA